MEDFTMKLDAVDLKRATYYLRPDQIKSLKLKAVHQERNLSEVVRDAIDRYLGSAKAVHTRRTVTPEDVTLL